MGEALNKLPLPVPELCKQNARILYKGTEYRMVGYQTIFNRKEQLKSVILRNWQGNIMYVNMNNFTRDLDNGEVELID